jgi:hypothetical protein
VPSRYVNLSPHNSPIGLLMMFGKGNTDFGGNPDGPGQGFCHLCSFFWLLVGSPGSPGSPSSDAQ